MKNEIRKEITRLIELNEITDSSDERIGLCIADRFPEMYSTEQEYIEFNQEIGSLVEQSQIDYVDQDFHYID